jgi:hypothetical protein
MFGYFSEQRQNSKIKEAKKFSPVNTGSAFHITINLHLSYVNA